MIRVLIADDSAVSQQLLRQMIEADPELRVVGWAKNGQEAVQAVAWAKPDVITMDIHMPVMDGLEATRRIMESTPVPIVVVSGVSDREEPRLSFRALEAGALTTLARPPGPGNADHEQAGRVLISTLKTMAGVRVIRRWTARPAVARAVAVGGGEGNDIRIIAVGASTGGPVALQTLLKHLPEMPVPMAVVQHISAGFCEGFVEWLGQSTGKTVRLATDGLLLQPGHIYVAPDGRHLELAAGPIARLTFGSPDAGLRPSVKQLFQSVARVWRHRAAAVLLTGMGEDGAEEMRLLKDLGALTIAQDEESCVVFGMPGAAVKRQGARFVLPPHLIAAQLAQSVATVNLNSKIL